jgi:hypothetical protein
MAMASIENFYSAPEGAGSFTAKALASQKARGPAQWTARLQPRFN